MTTMKAVVMHEAGGPEVLKIESRPIPTSQSGEVLIQVKAFGLNRSELFTRNSCDEKNGFWDAGRTFLPEEHQPGRHQVVVLSHGLWQRLFSIDSQVIGRAIELGGRSYTVVGVLPPHLDWPIGNDLWSPLPLTDKEAQERQGSSLAVLGAPNPQSLCPS